jgi:hypothetical protein
MLTLEPTDVIDRLCGRAATLDELSRGEPGLIDEAML